MTEAAVATTPSRPIEESHMNGRDVGTPPSVETKPSKPSDKSQTHKVGITGTAATSHTVADLFGLAKTVAAYEAKQSSDPFTPDRCNDNLSQMVDAVVAEYREARKTSAGLARFREKYRSA
jgi:hypothetical protein